jgi:hypothetical protein
MQLMQICWPSLHERRWHSILANWFRVQALKCIEQALRARDARIKRLFALEAQRWSRLAHLKQGADLMHDRPEDSPGKDPP